MIAVITVKLVLLGFTGESLYLSENGWLTLEYIVSLLYVFALVSVAECPLLVYKHFASRHPVWREHP
jgi:hypothetical protein